MAASQQPGNKKPKMAEQPKAEAPSTTLTNPTHHAQPPHRLQTLITSAPESLTSVLASPNQTSPTSAHAAADAERAIRHTQNWKPVFNRRQSWSMEEQKREILMKDVTKDLDFESGMGFSEK